MRKTITRILAIGVVCFMLAVTPTGCGGHAKDYHEFDNNKWLIEQVEQGNMTAEEARKIREEWK